MIEQRDGANHGFRKVTWMNYRVFFSRIAILLPKSVYLDHEQPELFG